MLNVESNQMDFYFPEMVVQDDGGGSGRSLKTGCWNLLGSVCWLEMMEVVQAEV